MGTKEKPQRHEAKLSTSVFLGIALEQGTWLGPARTWSWELGPGFIHSPETLVSRRVV